MRGRLLTSSIHPGVKLQYGRRCLASVAWKATGSFTSSRIKMLAHSTHALHLAIAILVLASMVWIVRPEPGRPVELNAQSDELRVQTGLACLPYGSGVG